MPKVAEQKQIHDTETYRLEEQVGFLLRLANQRHTAIFARLAPFDLTPTQFAALVRLVENGECSQNELGRRTAMDVATIKGVVDRLRSKGLVELKPDPEDRRRTLISVSSQHGKIVNSLHEAGRLITKKTLGPLNAADRRTFLRLLAKMAKG